MIGQVAVIRAIGAVGSALPSHGRGHQFESGIAHHEKVSRADASIATKRPGHFSLTSALVLCRMHLNQVREVLR